jgi:hypothetical protein
VHPNGQQSPQPQTDRSMDAHVADGFTFLSRCIVHAIQRPNNQGVFRTLLAISAVSKDKCIHPGDMELGSLGLHFAAYMVASSWVCIQEVARCIGLVDQPDMVHDLVAKVQDTHQCCNALDAILTDFLVQDTGARDDLDAKRHRSKRLACTLLHVASSPSGMGWPVDLSALITTGYRTAPPASPPTVSGSDATERGLVSTQPQ